MKKCNKKHMDYIEVALRDYSGLPAEEKNKIMKELNVDLVRLAMALDIKLSFQPLSEKEKHISLVVMDVLRNHYNDYGKYNDPFPTYPFFMQIMTHRKKQVDPSELEAVDRECRQIILGEVESPGVHWKREPLMKESKLKTMFYNFIKRRCKKRNIYIIREEELFDIFWEIDKAIFLKASHDTIPNCAKTDPTIIFQEAEAYSILIQRWIACYFEMDYDVMEKNIIRYLGISVT